MRTIRPALLLLVGIAVGAPIDAQSADALRAQIRAYRTAHDVEILREFSDFLALPNLASDSVNIRRNAQRLLDMLGRRGVAGRLLESPTGGPPAVYGEL